MVGPPHWWGGLGPCHDHDPPEHSPPILTQCRMHQETDWTLFEQTIHNRLFQLNTGRTENPPSELPSGLTSASSRQLKKMPPSPNPATTPEDGGHRKSLHSRNDWPTRLTVGAWTTRSRKADVLPKVAQPNDDRQSRKPNGDTGKKRSAIVTKGRSNG